MKMKLLILSLIFGFAHLTLVTIATAGELTKEVLENAEYELLGFLNDKIFDRKVKLVNGRSDAPFVTLDYIAFGDLNNDKNFDAAVILEECGGASATSVQVAAVINKNGKPYHIASRLLGSNLGFKKFIINKNYIIIDMAGNPKYGRPPTKVVKYKLVGNELVGPPGF